MNGGSKFNCDLAGGNYLLLKSKEKKTFFVQQQQFFFFWYFAFNQVYEMGDYPAQVQGKLYF